LCGVDRQVILDDYNKSYEGLYTQYEDVKDEMNDLGLKDEFAHTEPEVSNCSSNIDLEEEAEV
jgi:hypothetical protein